MTGDGDVTEGLSKTESEVQPSEEAEELVLRLTFVSDRRLEELLRGGHRRLWSENHSTATKCLDRRRQSM